MTETLRNRRAAFGVAVAVAAGLTTVVSPTAATAATATTPLAPTALTLHSGNASEELGTRLSTAQCDVDADGLADLTAGAAINPGSTSYVDGRGYRSARGEAGSAMSTPNWWTWANLSTVGGFSCGGDVNADGFDDFVQLPVAANRALAIHQSAGTRNLDGKPLENRVRNYNFAAGTRDLGAKTAGLLGDFDGDGFDDAVVSEHAASSQGRTSNGRLWVLRGKASASIPAGVEQVSITPASPGADLALVIDGGASSDAIGSAVAVGDLNDDGFDDLAVASATGKVWAIYGAAPAAQPRTLDLANLAPADGQLWVTGPAGLGSSMAWDGAEGTLVLGAAATHTATGGVAVVTAKPGELPVQVSAETMIRGEGSTDGFGYSVAASGDLDGDGRSDIVVGAPNAGENGAAYIVSGSERLVRIDGTRGQAQAASQHSRFGHSVAVVGDIDGNGAIDLAIGAPGRSEKATGTTGAVVVALRGDLETSTTLRVAKLRGDSGTVVADGDQVATGTRIDLRAQVRNSVGQGVTGTVGFSRDSAAIAGCDSASATVEDDHRGLAFCESTVTVGDYGLHSFGAEFAGVGANLAGSVAAPVRVVGVAEAEVALSVPAVKRTGTLTATVAAKGATSPLDEGTVAFQISGTPTALAGCEAVAVTAGKATCELTTEAAAGAEFTAAFSGVEHQIDGDDVTVVRPAQVTASAGLSGATATVSVSKARSTYGSVLRATVSTTSDATKATIVVDGRDRGTVTLAGGKASATLPLLNAGNHTVAFRIAATSGSKSVTTSAARISITKATAGAAKVKVAKFAKKTKPKVTLTLARHNNGALPVGRVTFKAGGKSQTVTLKASANGKVTVRLKAKIAAAKKLTVTYVPSDGTNFSGTQVATTLRPRG